VPIRPAEPCSPFRPVRAFGVIDVRIDPARFRRCLTNEKTDDPRPGVLHGPLRSRGSQSDRRWTEASQHTAELGTPMSVAWQSGLSGPRSPAMVTDWRSGCRTAPSGLLSFWAQSPRAVVFPINKVGCR